MATAAESTLNFHGENMRTCCQRRMPAPTASPASSTSGVNARDRTWAAAASPTGPAPMMTTGRDVSAMAGFLSSMGGARGRLQRSQVLVNEPLDNHDIRPLPMKHTVLFVDAHFTEAAPATEGATGRVE